MKTKKPAGRKLTVGMDLGDRHHHVCVLDGAGEIVAREVIVNSREVLTAFCARYPGATFVMETGTHSPWVSRLVWSLGHPVIVANARKVRAISENQTKCDDEDAEMLARLGRADPKLLSPVRHRSEATQRALVRLKVREALVRNRVNLINSVRFLLKSLGVFVSSSIKAMAFPRKVRDQLAAADLALVTPLLAAIEASNAEIKQLDTELEALAREGYPVTERLRQIPGVGPLTALCFVLTLESPKHFAQARAAGPYLGLVPERDQSGLSDKQLGITKAGHVQLRCLLVNCAHYILGPFGPPCVRSARPANVSRPAAASPRKNARSSQWPASSRSPCSPSGRRARTINRSRRPSRRPLESSSSFATSILFPVPTQVSSLWPLRSGASVSFTAQRAHK